MMSRRLIYISISLITAALICVVSFQVAWYNNAHALKKQLYERSVQDALKEVVTRVENREVADVITDKVDFYCAPAPPAFPAPEGVETPPEAETFIAEVRVPPAPPSPKIITPLDTSLVVSRNIPSRLSWRNHVTTTRVSSQAQVSLPDSLPMYLPVHSTRMMIPQRKALQWTDTVITDRTISRVYTSTIRSDSIRIPVLPSHMAIPEWNDKSAFAWPDTSLLFSFTDATVFNSDSFFARVMIPDMSAARVALSKIPAKQKKEGTEVVIRADQQRLTQEPVMRVQQIEISKPASEPEVRVRKKLDEVLNKLVQEIERKETPQDKRIPKDTLAAYITQALHNQGITESFLFDVKNDSVPGRGIDTLTGKCFTVSLYPHDLWQSATSLQVLIPGQEKYIFKSMTMHLAGSVLFTLMIIGTFAYTLYVMLKQKKIAGIKNDFINNMTHEFKTPIATISLATDTISNPHAVPDRDKILHYMQVIREENRRMNSQVEKVLQLALTDKNNFELNLTGCSLHTLVKNALHKFDMIVEVGQRQVVLELKATNDRVTADVFHLEHAIANMIDNAIKYSAAHTTIRIRTADAGRCIQLYIMDEGIGMKKEVQRKVFDKFYRAQGGNLHDVKGFGIGLSYVKNVVDAHKGRVHVQSTPGKGTTFIITLNKEQHV